MPMTIEEVGKNAKLVPVLKAYMKAQHNDENFDFFFSKDSPEKIYAKFINAKSATQVNLPSDIQKKLDDLAAAKKWKDMAGPIGQAKTSIAKLVNNDVMPRFATSKEYLATLPPAAAPVDLGPLKAEAAKIEKDIADGTAFINTATATVKSKGLPKTKEGTTDPKAVDSMFQSMRMRHDKVHEPFTALLQKNKNFTKASFGSCFAKKEAFTKLCMEYRKLLAK
jgi:hypothetical protein